MKCRGWIAYPAIQRSQGTGMATNYDQISTEYKLTKLAPWRIHIELFTLFELIGDVAGKSVLDLACGEGFLTRELKTRGARRVVGVDKSRAMIDLARAQEQRQPLGIEYVVQDVKGLAFGERFDLVVAGWLLNYARTREELLSMCQAIERHLVPGGRLCSINNDNEDPPEHLNDTRKYGFVKSAPEPIFEGDPITWTFFLDDRSVVVENYYLNRATYAWAFEAANLQSLRFHAPRLAPAAIKDGDAEFWAAFLKHPPAVFIEASKQS